MQNLISDLTCNKGSLFEASYQLEVVTACIGRDGKVLFFFTSLGIYNDNLLDVSSHGKPANEVDAY